MKEILFLTCADSAPGFALTGVRQQTLIPEATWEAIQQACVDPEVGVIAADSRLLATLDPIRLPDQTAGIDGSLAGGSGHLAGSCRQPHTTERRTAAPGAESPWLPCEVATMNGTVTSISGATVCVDLADLKIGDRVFVGTSRLTGEVVRIDDTIATVQVFEENRGLGIGEPVTTAGDPLTVALGPGLLGGIFDG
ncbi:MAG: hypothetical protein EP304_05740, partial [Deltaproteobacteria bacterium]